MAKTADRGAANRPSPKDVGRTLRQVRKQQGLSRTVVARSAGLTRRELSAYERGRVEVPESDLWCLAGSCGVEIGELLPRRDPLRISGDLSEIGVGDTVRRLRTPVEPDGLLHEYLAMIYELRNLPAGSRIPLRQPDLVALADALGGTPEAIERRLVELIGATPNEAARLRAMIMPPLSLPAGSPEHGDPYAVLAQGGALSPAAEDFFAAPAPVDPFAPAPPPAPATPPPAAPAAMGVDPAAAPTWAPAPVPPAPVAFRTLTEGAPVVPTPAPMPMPMPTNPGGNLPPHVDPTMTVAANSFVTSEPRPSDAFAGPVDPGMAAAPGADPFAVPRTDDPLAPPPRPPDPFAGPTTVAVDPFATDEPRPSDPFAGPVDPGTAAAARSADPFELPRGDDPLAPPPLPPDPFAVSTPVGAPSPPGAADPGASPSDPFAVPAAGSTGFGTDGSSGFGVTVLDAIVVDDPLSDPPPAATLPVLDTPPAVPAPISPATVVDAPLPPVDLVTPDLGVPMAPVEAVPPIAWSAATAEAAPEPAGAPDTAPRFERASAQWEMGGIFPATAIADDGTLALRRADARWALTDLRAPGDFILEAAVDFRAGAGFGLVFRGSIDHGERISGYSFDLDPVASGGGYLLRLWDGSRQHWRPLGHTPVGDTSQLYGRHSVRVTLRSDQLTAQVDDDPVLEIASLSRASIEAGREPCRGDRIGIQAWSTTEVTVESFRVATL